MTLTSIDGASGVVTGTVSDEGRSARLVNVRPEAGVRLDASHAIPTINNHMTFERDWPRRLKGTAVSTRVRTPSVRATVAAGDPAPARGEYIYAATYSRESEHLALAQAKAPGA